MSSPLIPRGRGAYQAFTLIELLTVIAIIGILSGLVFGIVRGATTQGRISRAKSELASLSSALESYNKYYGDYPWVGNDTAPNQINPAAAGFSPSSTDRAFNLFRALNGRIGPKQTVNQRQYTKAGAKADKYGKAFVDPTTFTLERDESVDAPASSRPLPVANPAQSSDDPDFVNAFIDPWGNRYQYYYKDVGSANAWKASKYILYSAGPDGLSTAPNAAGAPPDPSDPQNADNLYALP